MAELLRAGHLMGVVAEAAPRLGGVGGVLVRVAEQLHELTDVRECPPQREQFKSYRRASPEESRRRKKLTLVLRARTTPPWQQTVVLGSTPIANLIYELTSITERPAYQTDPTSFSSNRGGQRSGPDT
jgi:hypothetical protein